MQITKLSVIGTLMGIILINLYLKPRNISVIMVKAPTELDTQHIYTLITSDDLPLGLILLADDHKIDHKYSKSLCIPILNTAYHKVHISRTTGIGALHPVEVESNEVSNILWTTIEQLPDSTKIVQQNF